MVILELYQGEYKKELVAFDSLEEGRAFVAQIPGYTLEKVDEFDMESFNPANLPDYMEIVYNGNIVPLSSGDSDTLAAITGSIAEAAYGIPEWIKDKAYSYLDEPLREVLRRWEKEVG